MVSVVILIARPLINFRFVLASNAVTNYGRVFFIKVFFHFCCSLISPLCPCFRRTSLVLAYFRLVVGSYWLGVTYCWLSCVFITANHRFSHLCLASGVIVLVPLAIGCHVSSSKQFIDITRFFPVPAPVASGQRSVGLYASWTWRVIEMVLMHHVHSECRAYYTNATVGRSSFITQSLLTHEQGIICNDQRNDIVMLFIPPLVAMLFKSSSRTSNETQTKMQYQISWQDQVQFLCGRICDNWTEFCHFLRARSGFFYVLKFLESS